jgi:hypothetical protein
MELTKPLETDRPTGPNCSSSSSSKRQEARVREKEIEREREREKERERERERGNLLSPQQQPAKKCCFEATVVPAAGVDR